MAAAAAAAASLANGDNRRACFACALLAATAPPLLPFLAASLACACSLLLGWAATGNAATAAGLTLQTGVTTFSRSSKHHVCLCIWTIGEGYVTRQHIGVLGTMHCIRHMMSAIGRRITAQVAPQNENTTENHAVVHRLTNTKH